MGLLCDLLGLAGFSGVVSESLCTRGRQDVPLHTLPLMLREWRPRGCPRASQRHPLLKGALCLLLGACVGLCFSVLRPLVA